MELFSRIHGEGRDVLILHGLFGMNDNWNTLGKRWAEDCGVRMHLLDLRNHGQSPHSPVHTYAAMAEDVVEYLDSHHIQSATIIGHSMGGKVAMRMAVDHPARVERMCVIDIAPKGYPVHHREIIDALLAVDFSKVESRKEADDALKVNMRSPVLRQFMLKSLYWKDDKTLDWRFNLKVIDENIEMVGEGMESEARYEGETLFVRGEASGYIQDGDMTLIKEHFPQATLHSVEGAGHWVHAEKPEEIYRVICQFITG